MWITLTAEDVVDELSSQEATMMTAAAGDKAAKFAERAVAEARGAIVGGGYEVGEDGTIPEGMKSDVIAIARWRWLIAFPQLLKLQTKERKDAYDDARKKLALISEQKFVPESPTPGTNPAGGSWGSETKLKMRTSGS
jgi:hypothetical protein